MVKVYPPDKQSPLIYPVNYRIPGQNAICTSHYNPWTFVFVNLFEQFHRLANIFFLSTAILQAIPQISSLDPVMGFVGLCFMLGISMVKAGYEDYLRHKADKAVNNQLITLWRHSGIHEQIKWIDIQPGDILIINDDDEFPADCVILDESSADKRCRIETSALDGETDLKYKRNISDNIDLKNTCFVIEMTPPTPSLSIFSGNLITSDSSKLPLSIHNFVPRGCILKKTQFALALVIYTGENTKIIMNSSKPKYKSTEIDHFLSIFVIFSIIFLISISVIFTVCSFFYSKHHMQNEYLQLEEMPKYFYFLNIFSWVLVLSNFIPLSLYSSIDIVRFFVSVFISHDPELCDETSGKRCACKNSDLVYTIGRITHIFSDKTGTLTKNQMTFKIVGFTDVVLGIDVNGDFDEEREENAESDESISLSTMNTKKQIDNERLISFSEEDLLFLKDNITKSDDVLFFIYTIVLSNSAMTSVNPNYYDISSIKKEFPDFEFSYDLPPPEVVSRFPYVITYLTGSPDELCLIHFARECGYILYDVSDMTVKVIINGELTIFERPVVFDYSSKRKRSSCIARIGDRYFMLLKGADSTVVDLCVNSSDAVFNYVQYASELGLRTLVYAIKEVDKIESIKARYDEIKRMNDGDETAIDILSKECEKELSVIAFTGVEDELQDEVGLTLRRLILGNIKVWMLTGDKLGTALQIGKTTELIDQTDEVIVLTFEDSQNEFEILKDANYERTVIALEGSTFKYYLSDEEKINSFFEYASLCSGVIIARCEPSQKGDVVRSFKKFNSKNYVLSIGDGANDVDMIRAADIGIGVEGKEGSEAVMSSDFSIPSFQFLSKLLLVYGHYCVVRISLLIEITLYKNVIIGVFQIYYGFFNGYSATDTFDSIFLTLFNLLFTIPQLFYNCVIEQDISAKYILAVPQIYRENQKFAGLNGKRVIEFYLLAIIHSASIFFWSYFENSKVVLNNSGMTLDYAIFTQINGWTLLLAFTIILVTHFKTISYFQIVLYVICVVSYMLVELVYSNLNEMFHAILPILFKSPRIWFTIPICVGFFLIVELASIYGRNFYTKPLSHSVEELEHVERNGRLFFSN